MFYLYQRWYNCQFKAQFSFKPCFPWPHLCCPRDINWPWVGRYQCIWKWNSNFWLLSSWNSWLQVVVEWKICLEELLGKHNEDGTCWEKKFHLRFTKFRKILPIHFSAKKIKSYGKLESKCIFSICMFDLQIIVTFPRSGKWNSGVGMWF